MKVFAHRGYHDRDRPENTLEAFQHAVDSGLDGIETDIRSDSLGTALLFHDRCLEDGTPISSLTRDDLQRRVGYPVPTLAEALGQGWGIEWDLEIKDEDGLRAALPVLRPFAGSDAMFVTSFAHRLVHQAVAELGLPGGIVIAHSPAEELPFGTPAANIPYLVWDFESITDDALAQATERGFRSMVYGTVTRPEHARAASMGLEAIITDHPSYCS